MTTELQEITMIQGEGKWIRFTFTRSGASLNMAAASKFFGIKRSMRDTAYAYQANDNETAKWDTTNAASGILRVNVPASFTKSVPPGKYDCQGRFILTADTDVDKTQRFSLKIVPGVVPN
jgi:hypothetical protein